MKIFNFFLLLLLPGVIYAADSSTLTRSAGKLVNDTSLSLDEKLSVSPVIESSGQIKQRGTEGTNETDSSYQYRSANHAIAIVFEIFDAWVELTGDLDDDGFYHHIKATFDADVNTSLETVYAKVYLSYEGGPWQQYGETDLFEISYDSANDTYEIATELIEGYEPGYYDVLIELHSFYHEGIVASRIVYEDIDGYAISLEDLQHDEVYTETEYYETEYYETDYYVSAGSFSWTGIMLLGLLLLIKFRYFPIAEK